MCDIKIICAFAKTTNAMRQSKLYEYGLIQKILLPYRNEMIAITELKRAEIKRYMQLYVLPEINPIRYVFLDYADYKMSIDTKCEHCYLSKKLYGKVHVCQFHLLEYGDEDNTMEPMTYMDYLDKVNPLTIENYNIDRRSFIINRPGLKQMIPHIDLYYNCLNYDEKIKHNRKIILSFIRGIKYIPREHINHPLLNCMDCYHYLDGICNYHRHTYNTYLDAVPYIQYIENNMIFNANSYYTYNRGLKLVEGTPYIYLNDNDFHHIHPVREFVNLEDPIYNDIQYYQLIRLYYQTGEWI